jgi:xylulokinase
LAGKISQEDFYAINPNIFGLNYSFPKLAWLQEHKAAIYHQAHKFLFWSDLVAFRLGCDAATSYSHANRSLLFDIWKQDWSEALLDLAGIERIKLPQTVASGAIAGVVSSRVAAELGLPQGVKVVVGGHDQCCNSLGAGIYQAGSSVCGIGTYECITPTFERIPDAAAMLAHGLNVEHHVLPNLYVAFIYNQAGALVRWFRDTFASADGRGLRKGENIYDALASEIPAEPTRLFTLPYFEITGPPGFVSDASGAIVGLKTSTTRGEILKSIMESVTFYFVDSIRALNGMGMETAEFIATGGGARSDQWLQIKADIFNVPFVRLRTVEGSMMGAAMLAGISTGVLGSPAEAVERFVKRDRVFEPDAARNQYYQQRLESYRGLFPLLKEFLARQEKGVTPE